MTSDKATTKPQAVDDALDFAFQYAQIGGDHHKMWVIDQMVKALCGADYDRWVEEYCDGGFHEWDKGIAP